MKCGLNVRNAGVDRGLARRLQTAVIGEQEEKGVLEGPGEVKRMSRWKQKQLMKCGLYVRNAGVDRGLARRLQTAILWKQEGKGGLEGSGEVNLMSRWKDETQSRLQYVAKKWKTATGLEIVCIAYTRKCARERGKTVFVFYIFMHVIFHKFYVP